MRDASYTQPPKAEARRRLWSSAVAALTQRRHEATLVRWDELLETVHFSLARIRQTHAELFVRERLDSTVIEELESWRPTYQQLVAPRSPNTLKVLYLCGPEPENDLREMQQLGLESSNVWAVESNAQALNAATPKAAASRLKLYHGDLTDFLESTNEVFDIIYFDSCSHIANRKPNPIRPILRAFARNRLAPVSALLTTFAEPNDDDLNDFGRLAGAFYRSRHNGIPEKMQRDLDPATFLGDTEHLPAYCERNAHDVNSDLVTDLLVTLGGALVPNCRVLADRSLRELFVASKSTQKEVLKVLLEQPRSIRDPAFLDHVQGYTIPAFDFVRALREPSNVLSALNELKFSGTSAKKVALPANILESLYGVGTDIASEPLKDALRSVWFDGGFACYSCDVPLPHLLINSMIGVVSRPYLANPRLSSRVTFRSKRTRMYSDCLIFDQCRYYFDSLPTLNTAPTVLSQVPFQVVARSMMDRFGWHDWRADGRPFRMAAVPCMGETPSARPFDFDARQEVT